MRYRAVVRLATSRVLPQRIGIAIRRRLDMIGTKEVVAIAEVTGYLRSGPVTNLLIPSVTVAEMLSDLKTRSLSGTRLEMVAVNHSPPAAAHHQAPGSTLTGIHGRRRRARAPSKF